MRIRSWIPSFNMLIRIRGDLEPQHCCPVRYLVDVFLEKVELLLHVGEVRGGQQRHNLRPQLRVIQHQLLYIIKIGLIYRTGTGNPCEDLYYKT